MKHRDDHVASVMDEAKASLVTITRDKAKYTGILQQLLTQGVILVSYYHSASMRGVPTPREKLLQRPQILFLRALSVA